jgi:hypothetical protein
VEVMMAWWNNLKKFGSIFSEPIRNDDLLGELTSYLRFEMAITTWLVQNRDRVLVVYPTVAARVEYNPRTGQPFDLVIKRRFHDLHFGPMDAGSEDISVMFIVLLKDGTEVRLSDPRGEA